MNKCYNSVNNWLLDISSNSIVNLTTGEVKRLGEYQSKLLNVLVKGAGKVFAREELIKLVWNRIVGINSLSNAIHYLRIALGDDGKAQRIIKTIPRKGYVLDARFCCLVEKKEYYLDKIEREIKIDMFLCPTVESCIESKKLGGIDESSLAAPHYVGGSIIYRRKAFFFRLIFYVIVITAGLCWYLFKKDSGGLMVREIRPGIYSNINIYAVETMPQDSIISTPFYEGLKNTLDSIDKKLKLNSTVMNVYFRGDFLTLDYTFIVSNKCDKKQLSMKVNNWSVNKNHLNKLILKETERGINELTTCKTK